MDTSRTLRRIGLGAGLAVALLGGIGASPAAAEEIECRGSMSAVTVDNLIVPQGATCRLNGTTIQGTLQVANSARLVARNVTVIGNVQAEGAASVTVRASEVGGSVQVVQGGGSQFLSNDVNGDVQYFENTGTIRITGNNIDGNLQCKSNNPAPTGGNNVVQGEKQDQCENL